MSLVLDRTQPPAVQPLAVRAFPEYTHRKLSGGIDVYFVRSGVQPVMEIQLNFKAGFCNEPKTGVAAITANLLSEGTKKYTSLQLSQLLDDYGAFWQVESGFEITSLSLSALSKYSREMTDILHEIVINAALPAQEFDLYIQRKSQQQAVLEKKTSFHARKIALEKLFGAANPYSKVIGVQELNAVTLDEVRGYYNSFFQPQNMNIIVAGAFDEEVAFQDLESVFGAFQSGFNEYNPIVSETTTPTETGVVVYEMPGLMQSSIRVGHLAFPRNHPDFNGMRLANTILGGYFGSRLMSNIREEKGYTYGIHSAWQCMKQGGYFMVSTDVGNEFAEDTLKQIQLEMRRLQEDKIGEKELQTVKNFLIGRIYDNLETPFQVADSLKNRLIFDLSAEEFKRSLIEIQETTAEQILSLCQKYLQPNDLLQVIAGKYEKTN